jgi:uncharacterized protein
MLRGNTNFRPRAWAFLLLALVAISILQTAMAQPRFSALTGRIVDEAGLLGTADKAALEQELTALEQKSTDQLVIYTARSLQGYEIEDFGYQLGRAWALGHKDKNNGVILIIAPKERKVRIEVGRGLEPQLTDAISKLIIENAILPAFRRGDFPAGIKAGVQDIRDVLLGDADAVKQRATRSAPRSSSGNEGLVVAFLVAFVLLAFLMVWMQAQETAHPGRVARDRRHRNAGWQSPGWGGSSGGWSGGGGSGGDGGFSGGGGDFGGGGASGNW